MTAKRTCGNPRCSVSAGIHEGLTFGSGVLDFNGFWSEPCAPCARDHERRHPEDAPCWPFEDNGVEANVAGMTYWKLENGSPVTTTIKPSIYDIDYVASHQITFDRVGPWTVATTLCSESPDENPRFKTLAHRAGDEGLYEAYATTVSEAVKCHAHALAYIVSDSSDQFPGAPPGDD